MTYMHLGYILDVTMMTVNYFALRAITVKMFLLITINNQMTRFLWGVSAIGFFQERIAVFQNPNPTQHIPT